MEALRNTLLGCILAAGLSTTACMEEVHHHYYGESDQSAPKNNEPKDQDREPEFTDSRTQDSDDSLDRIVDQQTPADNKWRFAGYGALEIANNNVILNNAVEYSYVHIDENGKETLNVRIAASSLYGYEWRFVNFQTGFVTQAGFLGKDRGGNIFFSADGWPDHSYAGNIKLCLPNARPNEGYWLCTDENHHIMIRKDNDGRTYITFEIKDGILDHEYDYLISKDFIFSGNNEFPPQSPPGVDEDEPEGSGGNPADEGFDSAFHDDENEANIDKESTLHFYDRFGANKLAFSDPRTFGASPGLDYFKKHEVPEDPIVSDRVLSETFLNGGRLYYVKTSLGQVMVPGSESNSAVLIGSGHWNKFIAMANSDWGQNHFKDESWFRMVPVSGERAAIPNASSYYTLVDLVNTETGHRGKLFHNRSTGETIGIHGKLCELYSVYPELGLPLRLIDYGWGKGFVTCENGYAMVSDTEFKVNAPGINVSGPLNDKPLTLSEIAMIAGELVSWILPTPSPIDIQTILDKNSTEYAKKWAFGGLAISLVPFGGFLKEAKFVKKAVKRDDFLRFISSSDGRKLADPLFDHDQIIVDKAYEDLFGPLMRKSDKELFDVTHYEINDVFNPRRNFASRNLKDLYWDMGSEFKGIFYEPNLLTGFSETKRAIHYNEPNIWMLFEEWMHADDFIKGTYDGVGTYIKKHLVVLDNMEKALREGHPVAKKILEKGYDRAALLKDANGKNVFERVREQLIKYDGLDELLDGVAQYRR